MALAHRHAQRIDVAIANGYTQMQPDELADILHHYLPPLTIESNGAHLLWAWSRMREQFIFFPWYARTPAARLASGMPNTQALHDAVMDLLRAGNGYSQAYRAAFEYDRAAVVSQIVAPTLIMTARTDALYRYLDAMPAPSASVTVQRPADYLESRRFLQEALASHRGERDPSPAAHTRPIDATLWREYLQTPHGSLFALRSNTGGGRPLLFCHGPTGSALGMREAMLPWLGQRPLLAVDLPGNGESDDLAEGHTSVTQRAECLADALKCTGFDDIDILAPDGGAAVAAELTRLRPQLVKNLLLTPQPPPFFGCRIELDEYGLHLLRVWNIVRDQQLYSPWHTRKRANVLNPSAAALDPAHIHARVLDVLKCLNTLPQIEAAYAKYPLEATLSALGHKVMTLAAN
jgi:pimeloyl-ACP methyl ester carboxylesterase